MRYLNIQASSLLLPALLALPSSVRAAPFHKRASQADYISDAVSAANALNSQWFDASTGEWQNTWWNSANALTTITRLAQIDSSYTSTAQSIWETVFTAAQATNGGSWLNDYYDDEGWWALAWIKVYDATQNQTYLSAAETIFQDLTGGLGGSCGGQWWDKSHTEVNTINNELFLAVAASLAIRDSSQQSFYENYATAQADWLLGSAVYTQNGNHTFEDSFDTSSCSATGGLWTYNHGTILTALVEMNQLTGNSTYLDTANSIASAAITTFSANGILTEFQAFPSEDGDTEQFKGVFARGLSDLNLASPNGNYVSFLQANADSIWANDNSDSTLGADWQGPVMDTSAASQSSALDCLVAAAIAS